MTTMTIAVSEAKKKPSDLIEEDRGVVQEDPTTKTAVAHRQVELQTPMMRATTTTVVALIAIVGAEQRRRLKLRPKETRCQTLASHLLKRIRPIIVDGKVVKRMMTKAQAKSKQKAKEVFPKKHRKVKIAIPQKMTTKMSLNLSLHPSKNNKYHLWSLWVGYPMQTQYQKRLSKAFWLQRVQLEGHKAETNRTIVINHLLYEASCLQEVFQPPINQPPVDRNEPYQIFQASVQVTFKRILNLCKASSPHTVPEL